MKCMDCNKEMKVVVKNHKYKESGLDNITLLNVKRYVCSSCGEEYMEIFNPLELHKVIAMTLVKNTKRITGKELRFLRKYLGFSSAFFAKIIGVTRETVSRWENGKLSMPKHIDLLIRTMVTNNNPDRNYSFHDSILKNEGSRSSKLKIGVKKSGEWEIKSAA